MPALTDIRLEHLARHPAQGLNATMAARAAGYAPTTAGAKGYALARRPDVQGRVTEIRAAWGEAQDGQQSSPPYAPEPPEATTEQEPEQPSTAADAAGRQSPAGAAPPPPAPVMRSAGPIDRPWLNDMLRTVAEDALTARDRRAAISAAAELAKLNGLQAPARVEVASPLDSLSAKQLMYLLELLEDGSAPDGEAEAVGDGESSGGNGAEPTRAPDLAHLP